MKHDIDLERLNGTGLISRLLRAVGFTPEADATVRGGSYRDDNFGLQPTLIAKKETPSYTRNSFLRFDLSKLQGSLTGATLRLHPTGVGQEAIINALAAVDDDTWGEEQITWENRPTMGGEAASWVVPSGEVVEVDVTALVEESLTGNRLLSLAIFSPQDYGSEGWVGYGSREASPDLRPELVLTGAVQIVAGDVDADSDNSSPAGEIEHSQEEEDDEDASPGKILEAPLPGERTAAVPMDVNLIDFTPSKSNVIFAGNGNLFTLWNADPSVPGTALPVEFNHPYQATDSLLNFTSGAWRRFYVEALTPGSGAIGISIDPFGDGQWQTTDSALFSAVLVDIDTDSNNRDGIDPDNDPLTGTDDPTEAQSPSALSQLKPGVVALALADACGLKLTLLSLNQAVTKPWANGRA